MAPEAFQIPNIDALLWALAIGAQVGTAIMVFVAVALHAIAKDAIELARRGSRGDFVLVTSLLAVPSFFVIVLTIHVVNALNTLLRLAVGGIPVAEAQSLAQGVTLGVGLIAFLAALWFVGAILWIVGRRSRLA